MVTQHFKLNVQPFGVTPDGGFLYLSRTHREAIASLLYGIQACRGFAALIAPPGMGKTTVLLHVLGLLRGNARTAFLFQTLCGPEQFLRSILADLGIDDQGTDVAQMHAKLNAFLLQESKAGRQVVVVIDEAQNLDEPVLELVRMLSNFETPGKKLIQLILCGQPQLATKLASERLTQLRQRISIIAKLSPFSAAETREYIDHRLKVAGAVPGNDIFSWRAYALIAARSGGIPRNINNLCFNAMSLACALKKPQIDSSMVRETIEDLDLSTTGALIHDAQSRTKPRFLTGLRSLHSWLYSAGIALGLFLALGLLAYNEIPSRLAPQRTISEVSDVATRESKSSSAVKEILREDLDDQVVSPDAPPKLGPLPPEPTSVETRQQSGTAPFSKLRPARVKKRADTEGIQSSPETPAIRLLPEDLERLRHGQISDPRPMHEDPAKNGAAPKHDQVPTESTPQRENR